MVLLSMFVVSEDIKVLFIVCRITRNRSFVFIEEDDERYPIRARIFGV